MIELNIDEIKSGMILAQPVYNGHDVLLLESGARVTKKNIRILRFKERAAKRAQISRRKDTPIFDIISHRYRLSGWPIFME